jgi:AcrR family transcriptional regulator
VGLKEVAREAGVSHALITHYFGTYAGLLEAAYERRLRALRETLLGRLRETGLSRPEELLDLLFRALRDPVHLRLMRWLLTSERPAAANAFGLTHRSLAVIADQAARALDPQPGRELVREIELTLLVGALGRQPSNELDDLVRHTIARMARAHIRATLKR